VISVKRANNALTSPPYVYQMCNFVNPSS